MSPSLILSCALLAAPAPLDQLVAHLGARRCDEAVRQVPSVSVPARPGPRERQAATAVSRGAARCREQDPKLGAPLAALAARLAPDDPEILQKHAESLLDLEDVTGAAAVLDRVVQQHPVKKAPQAWLLRAQIALRAGDDVLALGLLEPLAEDPAWKERAAPLLADAQAALERRGDDAVTAPAPAPTPPRLPTSPSTPPRGRPAPQVPEHRSGEVVANLPGSIEARGTTTLTVRGLVPSRVYLFKAAGSCQRWVVGADMEGNPARRPAKDEAANLDFRVQFGKQPSRSLPVGGLGVQEESSLEFFADAPEMTIQVSDQSSHVSTVTCTVGRFSVVAR